MHKIGTVGFEVGIVIRTFQLQCNDTIFLGSDGRDDILFGIDEKTGQRIINEDETRFLRCVEEADGALPKLVEAITQGGELTDDFTLVRIEWKKENPAPSADYEAVCQSAHKALADKDAARAVQLLDKAMRLYPDSEVIEKLVACHRERGEFQEIIQAYQYGLKTFPLNETLLHNMLKESRRMVRDLLSGSKTRENTKMASECIQLAIEYGERLLNVNPQHYKGMLHVADYYRIVGRFADAREMLARAREIVPEDDNLKTLERLLDHDEAQYAQAQT
jgi:tetratricopeptide (TPR) repeat protein